MMMKMMVMIIMRMIINWLKIKEDKKINMKKIMNKSNRNNNSNNLQINPQTKPQVIYRSRTLT